MAQLVKHLTSAQVKISRSVSSRPVWGSVLTAQTTMDNLKDTSILARGALGETAARRPSQGKLTPPYAHSEGEEPQGCPSLLQDPEGFPQSSTSRTTGTDPSPSRAVRFGPTGKYHLSLAGPWRG